MGFCFATEQLRLSRLHQPTCVRPMSKTVAASLPRHLDELFDERWSCRGFLNTPVPEATIRAILTTAQKTASWCNSQAWQVTMVSGKTKEKLSHALLKHAAADGPGNPDIDFPREYRGVYLDRRRRSGFQLYEAMNIPRGDKERYRKQAWENFSFFGAPHVAIITSDEALGAYGAVDCGGYVSSFLLAATAHGVATIPQAALSWYAKIVKDILGIGSDRLMVCGISFGYPDRDHPANSYRTERASLDEVVHWLD